MAKVNATSKMLKAVHTWRFLASGSNVTLTPLYQWTTAALKAIQPRAAELWTHLQEKAGIPRAEQNPPWFIDSADAIAGVIADLNISPMQQGKQTCHDVKQLFTNIPHDDLLEKIDRLLEQIWKMMAQVLGERPVDVRLVVPRHKSDKNPEWITSRTIRRGTSSQRILTREMLYDWVKKCVENCHVRLGNVVLRQVTGIPMGANMSPFLSNLYLFTYELDFMEQFLPGIHGTEQTWDFFTRHFKHTVRYQDDRWTSSSKYIARALSRRGWWGTDDASIVLSCSNRHPYRGIYPTQYLELTIEQEDELQVQHQDLYIVKANNERAGSENRWIIRLYDRKSDPKLEKMRQYIVYYNQAETFLADTCLYGVVYSESRRMAMRCSVQVDFEAGVARMLDRMLLLKYNKKKLAGQVTRFFSKFPAVYGRRSGKHIEARMKAIIYAK